MIHDEEMVPFLDIIIDSLPVEDVKLHQIIAAQAEDSVCSTGKDVVLGTDTLLLRWTAVHNNLKISVWSFQDGWPDKFKMPASLKPYWNLGVSFLLLRISFLNHPEF